MHESHLGPLPLATRLSASLGMIELKDYFLTKGKVTPVDFTLDNFTEQREIYSPNMAQMETTDTETDFGMVRIPLPQNDGFLMEEILYIAPVIMPGTEFIVFEECTKENYPQIMEQFKQEAAKQGFLKLPPMHQS